VTQQGGPSWARLAAWATIVVAAYVFAAAISTLLLPSMRQSFGAAALMFVGVIAAVLLMMNLITRSAHPRTRAVMGTAYAVGSIAALIIFFPQMAQSMLRAGTWTGPVAFFIPVLGIQLMVFALRHRRAGDSLHCPKCDYELGVSPDEAPPRCTECGTPWLGKWERGRSRRSPRLAAVGVLIAVLGSAPLVMQWTGLGSASLSLLSNPMLISVTAIDAWGNNKGSWSELNRRKLTPAEHDLLAEKLLELRRAQGYLYGPPAAWLDTAATAGTISAPLVQRYYDDWFEPRLSIPAQVRLNEQVLIRMTAEERRGGPNTWMYIWVRQVLIDGTPIQDAEFERARRRWFFSLDFMHSKLGRHLPQTDLYIPPLDTSAPGERTITVTGYRCVVPVGTTPKQLDETTGPAPPPGALHFHTFEVSKTVTIK
jgi:hypothetical protein